MKLGSTARAAYPVLVLNPDDPRPAYLQIADALRAAYQPGVQLDSTEALSAKWKVAKQTIRAAVEELRKEDLVVSWQGRGVFYRAAGASDGAQEKDGQTDALDAIMSRLDQFDRRLSVLEQSQGQPAATSAAPSDEQ